MAADSPVQILGPNGQPFPQRSSKASMLAGANQLPYDAADMYNGHMADWYPFLWSPDAQLNIYRDRIVSRVRDLVRNDGWASGAITRVLDNAVGANFRPVSKPDYRALAVMSGNKAFNAEWASEFGRVAEVAWRNWSNDPNRYCDAQRKQTVSQMLRVGFRHKLIDGDALAVLLWLEDQPGRRGARYSTTVQLIDPDRLSNPQLQFDQQSWRGGVQIDQYGAAVGYWIREAHQGNWWDAAKSMTWKFMPRETPDGRPIVIHDFEVERAGQHRGGAGILTPVIQRLKMLFKYDTTELDASILNAIFGAYVESPYDPAMVEDALGGPDSDGLGPYQTARSEFHNERRITLGEVRMPTLFPGEKINAVDASRPVSNFKEFENAVLRNVAAGSGLSAQQVSNDWSDVNYSSARAALLESWKTLTRRRDEFADNFATPIWSAFLEEAMEIEDFPMPAGAPDFVDARGAYSRCRWIGPGRGWIDPVAERQGSILGMGAGLSTLEQEVAENAGNDWEEVLDQRAREIEAYHARGLEPPDWTSALPPTDNVKKPETP